jgi:hypothetical protein
MEGENLQASVVEAVRGLPKEDLGKEHATFAEVKALQDLYLVDRPELTAFLLARGEITAAQATEARRRREAQGALA